MKLTLKINKAQLVWGQMVEASEHLVGSLHLVEVEGWGRQESSWSDIFSGMTQEAWRKEDHLEDGCILQVPLLVTRNR